MSNVLEISHLTKKYNRKTVLNDISFSAELGQITGFIGVNGAGKTTTIKSILGLVKKDAGEIRLFGQTMEENEREIKNRIGVVFDKGYFYENLSLNDMKNILAPAYSNWDENAFKRYARQFKLPLSYHISDLSKGMTMKYAIALALSHHADFLLMDEPTSGLDPLIRNQLLGILREYMEEGNKSVFFSTHITTDLDKIADRIVMIDNGKIVLDECKDDLLEKYTLVKGSKEELTPALRASFLHMEEHGFHFEGLTCDSAAVKRGLTKAVFAKPTIEDIMMAFAGRS